MKICSTRELDGDWFDLEVDYRDKGQLSTHRAYRQKKIPKPSHGPMPVYRQWHDSEGLPLDDDLCIRLDLALSDRISENIWGPRVEADRKKPKGTK